MGNIPTIPGTASIQDQQVGVKRNLGAEERPFEAARGAIRQGVQAITQATGQIEDYEIRKQQAEEAYLYNKNAITLLKVTSDYREKVKSMPDKQIVSNWKDVAKTTKENILSDTEMQDMTPAAKKRMTMALDKWQGQTTGEFQLVSDKLGIRRRHDTAVFGAKEFIKTGDPALLPNALNAIDLAVKAKDMTPEQGKFYTDQFPERLATAQASNLIIHDPMAAYKALGDDSKFPDIKNQNERETLRRGALQAWNQSKVQNYNDIRKQRDAGKVFTKEELGDMVDQGKINGSSVDTILSQQAGEIKKRDVEVNRSKVHDMILDIKETDGADKRLEEVTKIHASNEYLSLPEAVKKDFDEALRGKTAKQPVKANPVFTQELESMKEDFTNGMAFIGDSSDKSRGGVRRVETMPDDKFKAAYPGQTRKDVVESARTNYAKKQQAFIDWSKDPRNKDKLGDPEAVQAERRRLEQPEVDAAVNKALGLTTGGTQYTKGQVYRDAKGNKATWNGTGWDEVK